VTTDLTEPPNSARLVADLRAAKIEMLSAECAAGRLRSRFSLKDIVTFGERRDLEAAIASAHALNRFFSQLEALIKVEDERQQ